MLVKQNVKIQDSDFVQNIFQDTTKVVASRLLVANKFDAYTKRNTTKNNWKKYNIFMLVLMKDIRITQENIGK